MQKRILKDHTFKAGDWQYSRKIFSLILQTIFSAHILSIISEYNLKEGCFKAYVSPNKDTTYGNILIQSTEKIRITQSYKYSSQ